MKTLLIIIILTAPGICFSLNPASRKQELNPYENRASLDSIKIKSHSVRILFWNVENLYDPYDDTTKLDDEFTSAGNKHWNWSKFSSKLNHVAKTILAAGEWSPPAIVGLCEVENRYVLNKLIYETPLKPFNYRIIHHESPDMRGVDVAMIYRPALFRIIENNHFTIRFPFDTSAQTREILLVKGVLFRCDTLFVFINHWPSRRGGYLGSQPRRNYVASILRKLIDSVQYSRVNPNILVMGDFNDEPENESLRQVLMARNLIDQCHDTCLYNLMGIRNTVRREGTLKYRDQWSTFDQFLVCGTMMNGNSGIKTGPEDVRILSSTFLLEDDNTYFGKKLNRTYTGPRYHGGFSDHLPIRLQLNKMEK